MVRHFSDKHPETTPPPVVSQSLVEAISSEMPEALAHATTPPEGYRWVYLHRTTWRYPKDKATEESKESTPLFLLPKDHQYGMYSPRSPLCYNSLSPDGKFYCFETLEATYCVKVQPYSEPLVLPRRHRLKFSPDSRFLCGYGSIDSTEKGVMIVVECATWRVRRLATLRCAAGSDSDYSCNHRFGWYPDSRHIWYQEDLPGLRRDYRRVAAYKQDVVSGRRRVLRGRDLDAVYNDWEMLNPRYRDGDFGMDGDRAFAYSPCQRVRVQVEPIDILERWAAGLQQVCVEWRDGCSQVVIERGRHKWHSILPLDVTRFPLRAGGTERVRGSVSLAKRGEPKGGGQM
jgi:hypothetical protein